MGKNFTITSAIFNEIIEFNFNTLDNLEENYQVLYQLAQKELNINKDECSEQEYDDMINDEINQLISVKMIHKEGLLYHALLKWYNRNEDHNLNGYSLKVLENVRSAVLEGDYLYYVTGCGYDTISSDLLGGSADGEAKYEFLKWINE